MTCPFQWSVNLSKMGWCEAGERLHEAAACSAEALARFAHTYFKKTADPWNALVIRVGVVVQ